MRRKHLREDNKDIGGHPRWATGDENNPDPQLRRRPIDGMVVLSGFTADGDKWRSKIYDPEEGKTYRSVLTRASETRLKVQGCIGPFCQTQYWTAAR